MTDEKMRDEFEAEVLATKNSNGMLCDLVRNPDGEYRSACERSAWWGWKASRAAIEVEWPDQHTYTAPDCAGAAILDCRTAFNKAVKVKP